MSYIVTNRTKGSGAIRKEVQILSMTAVRYTFRQLLLKFFERCRREEILRGLQVRILLLINDQYNSMVRVTA